MSAGASNQGFREPLPIVARFAALLAGLGYVVGLLTTLGLWSSTPITRAAFTTAHLCLMGCFLWFWLKGIRYWWVRARFGKMLDPFMLSNGCRSFIVRVALQILGLAYFVWAVLSAGQSPSGWAPETVRAHAAGWALFGTIVATSLGPLERRTAAYQAADAAHNSRRTAA
jgi:hypothetical protein